MLFPGITNYPLGLIKSNQIKFIYIAPFIHVKMQPKVAFLSLSLCDVFANNNLPQGIIGDLLRRCEKNPKICRSTSS